MRALVRLLLVITPLFTLAGCGFMMTKVEINEQTFVFAIYIDKGKQPNTVEVTISAPLPNRLTSGSQAGGQGSGDPYAMVTKSSVTVQDALSLIQRDLTRRFDFSHTRSVVVGHRYAEAGLHDLMDWFQREPTTDLDTYLFVAPGEAKQVASLTPVFEQMPSEVLARIGDRDNVIGTTFLDCLIGASANQGYALTYLSAGMKPMIADQGKLEPWVGVQGTALFQDHRLRATLPLEPSLTISWAENQLKGSVYTVNWDKSGKASVFLIQNRAKKSVRLVDGRPVFTIKLNGIGDVIFKRNGILTDSLSAKYAIERELNEVIKEQLATAMRTSQRVRADILQLGMLLDWNYPDYWEKVRRNWSKTYAEEAVIEIVTDVKVRNFGSVLKSKPE
ncbi:Ger(x)C family spore germination protein [Paenibacillus ihbetae]|uniref:Spore gernimation protein GerC n=1 Tax=Paenibacillus ihbetae TaxID=1870820 RepID=A0ABX3K0V3_9BACL|nr:Ger(x)C family spore germination protein [Paenibacillus ihbetae]OOC63050.1 spore gernimation protein GerC [Paenibacillus ihbetae]